MTPNKINAALLGVAVGDAVGVPFEFRSVLQMQQQPAKDMIGFGTHNQLAGTWSDDASLTFCLAASLIKGYDLQDIASHFIQWRDQAYWSARGKVFDIGITTNKAISRLIPLVKKNDVEGLQKLQHNAPENDNGNGSLMRILPLLFYIKGKDMATQFAIIWEVSALTHRHIRAAMSCLIYLRLAEHLLAGKEKIAAYQAMQQDILAFWQQINFDAAEQVHFTKVIQQNILDTPKSDLKTGGYVIEVLESSIWFFLNCSDYEQTILSIINLGDDTDTSAAIAGGLAGLYYGQAGIPAMWLAKLARLEDIVQLGQDLETALAN